MNIKDSYVSTFITIENYLSKHFNQADQIVQLKHQVSQNEKYKILYLKNQNQQNTVSDDFLDTAEVISYIDFNNFSKVLLKVPKKIDNISALITNDGYSAGIMIKENSQYIGLLNYNEKSNYAVFIGENLVPGITHGDYPNENIIVKYIPIWKDIKINDEVITSGMDNIFYKGVKVGFVVKINKLSTTQEAIVKPYANVYKENTFYLYTKDGNTSN
ncbi:MAG: rod shape-determining protein MreC [Arcobacteraceae bacterium]|nr:rod shape-determining protein MreC [Arcobacteraceae bacterium]